MYSCYGRGKMNYYLSLFKNIDKILLALPVCFAVISIIMIGSTAYDGAFIFNRDLKVQSAAYIIGFISIFFILMMDYKTFQKYEKSVYIGSILFLLTVYVPGLGVAHFGARSWINLGVTDLQPSELVKITFVLLFANYLSRNSENLFTYKGVFFAALYGGSFIVIVLKEDLGSAIVMCIMWIIMVFLPEWISRFLRSFQLCFCSVSLYCTDSWLPIKRKELMLSYIRTIFH